MCFSPPSLAPMPGRPCPNNPLAALAPTSPLPPGPDQAPAPCEAGGGTVDLRRVKHSTEHHETAELVGRLEAITSMYKSLVSMKVGTNMIESECRRIVKERELGPTGHRLLEVGQGGSSREGFKTETTSSEGLHCWRDLQLIKKMTEVRRKLVKERLKKARQVLAQEMKYVSSVMSKAETGKAWSEVREIRREVWLEEQGRLQRKIKHLAMRAANCSCHKDCRELDQEWEKRQDNNRKVAQTTKRNALQRSGALETRPTVPLEVQQQLEGGGEDNKVTGVREGDAGGEGTHVSRTAERAKGRVTQVQSKDLGPMQLEGGDGNEKAAGLGVGSLEGGDGGVNATVIEVLDSGGGGTVSRTAERAKGRVTQVQGKDLGPMQLEGGDGNEKAAGLGVESL